MQCIPTPSRQRLTPIHGTRGMMVGLAVVIVVMASVCGAARVMAQTTTESQPSSTATLKQKALEAWAALKDYGYDRKEQVAAKSQQLLHDLDARIDALEARLTEQSATASAAAKAQWQKAVESLKDQREQAAESLRHLQHSSKDAWEDAKQKFNQAYQDSVEAMQKTYTKLTTPKP